MNRAANPMENQLDRALLLAATLSALCGFVWVANAAWALGFGSVPALAHIVGRDVSTITTFIPLLLSVVTLRGILVFRAAHQAGSLEGVPAGDTFWARMGPLCVDLGLAGTIVGLARVGVAGLSVPDVLITLRTALSSTLVGLMAAAIILPALRAGFARLHAQLFGPWAALGEAGPQAAEAELAREISRLVETVAGAREHLGEWPLVARRQGEVLGYVSAIASSSSRMLARYEHQADHVERCMTSLDRVLVHMDERERDQAGRSQAVARSLAGALIGFADAPAATDKEMTDASNNNGKVGRLARARA